MHLILIKLIKDEWKKFKEQDNFHLIVAFLFFVIGITFSYYELYKISFVLLLILVLFSRKLCILFSIGFFAMYVDLSRHSQMLIDKPYKNIEIQGFVEKSSQKEGGMTKYEISHIETEDLLIDGKVMLYCKKCQNIPINSLIKAKVTLVPLPKKVYPTAYNVAKKYIFRNFSGFAFAQNVTILQTKSSSNFLNISTKIRNFFIKKQHEFTATQQVHAVIESIFFGEQSMLSQEQNDIFRKTGLSHIIAISGMHITVMAMIFYQIFFRVLAIFPTVRNNINLRKFCLLPALVLSFFYLCIAGMPVSGLRSFFMIAFATIIFTINAKPKLFASIVFSGFILLAIYPHELFFASFQLSFLAVLYFSIIIEKLPQNMNFITKYIITTVKSTIFITIITAPVVIFHFGGISIIGPISNIIAIPLFNLFIMPIGLLFFCLTPLLSQTILTKLVFTLLVFFVQFMLDFSSFFSNFSFSFLTLKDMPFVATMCILGGVLALFLIKSLLKIVGIISIIIGIGIFVFSQTPDIIANDKAFVFRDKGRYYIIGEDKGFAQSIWKSKLGIGEDFANGEEFCKEGICIGNKVTFVKKSAKISQNSITQCTEILAIMQDANLKQIPCKYDVIITENVLKNGEYFALKYSKKNKSSNEKPN